MDELLGQTLSHYRIVEKIGAGGMGEVYCARDTRLGRDVAIKVLPEAFSADPDRLIRFEREAKVLASLNHPNLAAIHGMEEIDGRRYLALEYVEGETLAARIARGPLSLEDTVEVGIQIASGMEAAHERGIVHRDLKPANVMITPGDQVKVVDFGLAKGLVAESGEVQAESPTLADSPALTHSPTIGTPATMPGVILGTAHYLSPEQARGKPVDRRTDIWSFGCVLYECLTGRRTFEGDSVPDVIARILRGGVEWERLPKSVPPALRTLLERCLEKDPRKRLRDMGDARLALEEIREGRGGPSEPSPARRALSPRIVAAAALLVVAAAAAGVAFWSGLGPGRAGSGGAQRVRHLAIRFPSGVRVLFLETSPDGRFILATGAPSAKPGEPPPPSRLYRRPIEGDRFEPVTGSEGYYDSRFSPDGRWIYLLAPQSSQRSSERLLTKVPMDRDAPPVLVRRWDGSWGVSFAPLASGDVLATTEGGAAFIRIPARGDAPSPPVRIEAPGFTGTFELLSALPGDRGVLMSMTSYQGGGYEKGIGLLDPRTGRARMLVRDGGCPVYSPTGHLLFTRRSTLLAVRFDLRHLVIRGDPVAITDSLLTVAGAYHASFTLSRDGTLTYLPGGIAGSQRRLVVVAPDGRMSEWSPERMPFNSRFCVNPAGDRVAFTITNARGCDEIWISQRGRPPAQRVIAIPGGDCYTPAWSPGGAELAYYRSAGDASDGIYVQPLESGAPRRICRETPPTFYSHLSWSPNGQALLGTRVVTFGAEVHLVAIPIPAPGDSLSSPRTLRASSASSLVGIGRFSPDGRQISYISNETGRMEVYVAPYRPDVGLGTPIRISTDGGAFPKWSRSGDQIYYQAPYEVNTGMRIMSASLRSQPSLTVSGPVPRWDMDRLGVVWDGFDILPDGRLLALQKDDSESPPASGEIVLNFLEELKQKLRAAERR